MFARFSLCSAWISSKTSLCWNSRICLWIPVQQSVCVYWGDKLPVRVRVEWALFHVAEPNQSAARPKQLSKLRWFLLAAISAVINWFSSKGKPAHIMPVFSSVKCIAPVWYCGEIPRSDMISHIIALKRSRFVFQSLEFYLWIFSMRLFPAGGFSYPTVSEFWAAHLQHDTMALCDLSSPLLMRLLSIKNLNSAAQAKKSFFLHQSLYLATSFWSIYRSAGDIYGGPVVHCDNGLGTRTQCFLLK